MNIEEAKEGAVEVDLVNIIIAPVMVTINAVDFIPKSRIGSFIGNTASQLISLPPITAPKDRKTIGVVLDRELSVVY